MSELNRSMIIYCSLSYVKTYFWGFFWSVALDRQSTCPLHLIRTWRWAEIRGLILGRSWLELSLRPQISHVALREAGGLWWWKHFILLWDESHNQAQRGLYDYTVMTNLHAPVLPEQGAMCTWLTGGHRCQAAHQISRIWKGGGWVHVLARGPLSVGVNLRSGGKWIPLQCTRRHFHVWWRLEQKRFIAGESITAEVRRTVWKDKRTQQGFAFLWTALWTLGEATVLSHSLFVQIHIGEALKIPPSSLATCVGRGSSVAGFCSPTRPIITLQSTNSSR